jgi:hypothetical protein
MRYARLVVFVLSILAASAPVCGVGAYTVSWLGNSFPGGSKWVQQDIEDIYVTGDGTVYAVAHWDEAGGEVTAYKDGDVVAVAGHTPEHYALGNDPTP